MGKKKRAKRLERLSESRIGVPEASAVALLPSAQFLIVDDERGVFVVTAQGDARRVLAEREFRDLEGTCVSPDGRGFLLTERDGGVHAFALGGYGPSGVKRIGRLPSLAKRGNRGWEGLTWLPAGVVPTAGESPSLAAVHQAKPRVIGIMAPEDVSERLIYRLPKAGRKALDKLSDLAWDPHRGTLLVLSGRAGRIAELRFVEDDDEPELELVGLFEIETARDDVPEGLCVDPEGILWVVTDGEGHLRSYRLPT